MLNGQLGHIVDMGYMGNKKQTFNNNSKNN